MKNCPYCGCMPRLTVRRFERDARGHALSFWYQYNCENKRCRKKPCGSFSTNKKDAEILWDGEIYVHSPI